MLATSTFASTAVMTQQLVELQDGYQFAICVNEQTHVGSQLITTDEPNPRFHS